MSGSVRKLLSNANSQIAPKERVMAGFWIKIDTTTPDKPEVFAIAEALGMEADEVLGKLIRVWVWADQQLIDGDAPGVTHALINRVAGCNGFAQAMVTFSWLSETDNGFSFPNFDRHNGNTAKTRALTAKRNRNWRRKRDVDGVTQALTDTETDTDIKKKKQKKADKSASVSRFIPPTVEDVQDYADQYQADQKKKGSSWPKREFDAEQFVDHYAANGWKVGRITMKDWKAVIRNWGRRQFSNGKPSLDEPSIYTDLSKKRLDP